MGKVTYITPSFYSSVYYWRRKEDAPLQDLYDLLDKKPIETTETMQRGIDFEDDVAKVCYGDYISPDPVANEVASIVHGCIWQEPIKTEVTFDGQKVLILGRMDCVKKDWIYDIKCVNRYEIGKYFHSIQHLAYMKATGINQFRYLVKCGNNLYIEEYREDNTNHNLLQERATDLLRWLKSVGLYDRYAKHWEVKDGR